MYNRFLCQPISNAISKGLAERVFKQGVCVPGNRGTTPAKMFSRGAYRKPLILMNSSRTTAHVPWCRVRYFCGLRARNKDLCKVFFGEEVWNFKKHDSYSAFIYINIWANRVNEDDCNSESVLFNIFTSFSSPFWERRAR